jgi:hypothetical protein
LIAPALVCLSASAVWYVSSHGWLQWFGDAEAHLNIARNITDNLTPGYDQLGTVWLPFPHLMMLPFVRVDEWWRSGIAGAFPSAACFIAGGIFLFAAVRRIFDSAAAALAACALACLNPNLLYLQSTSMNEGIFFGELMALLYFSVRFRQSQGTGSVCGAALASLAATLTRYEGWFLLPFVVAYFLIAAKRRRIVTALLFSAIAGAGPLYWMAHNWYLTGDGLDFLRGPYSARAIQGNKPYPGFHDWSDAWRYYRAAAQLCAGPALPLMGAAGVVMAVVRRAFWPVLLLALPPLFYVWSLHSSGTPIYVPHLWPNSYYNTRYGLAALPLLAFTSAALVMAMPVRFRGIVAAAAVVAGTMHWVAHPQPENWVTWAESRANSQGRRAWTNEAADYLMPRYVRGSAIITNFGDLTGIFRRMGVPLRDTFTGNNGLPWEATVRRPDLFLNQDWLIVANREGRSDPLRQALDVAERRGIRYTLEKSITINKFEPVIEIYRLSGGTHGPS